MHVDPNVSNHSSYMFGLSNGAFVPSDLVVGTPSTTLTLLESCTISRSRSNTSLAEEAIRIS